MNSESIVVVASLDTPTAAVTTLTTTTTTTKKKKKKTKNIMNTHNNNNNDDDKDTTHDERKNTITKPKKRFGVLHMGPHKTGTSTIQQLLHDDTIFNLLGDDGWDALVQRYIDDAAMDDDWDIMDELDDDWDIMDELDEYVDEDEGQELVDSCSCSCFCFCWRNLGGSPWPQALA